jgi:hypothetical protein
MQGPTSRKSQRGFFNATSVIYLGMQRFGTGEHGDGPATRFLESLYFRRFRFHIGVCRRGTC